MIHSHGDVIKWKHFPCYWPFLRGIHKSPVNSSHKDQWGGALMFSLNYASTKGWVNNRDPGGSRRHRAHYDVTVMPFGRYIYHYNGIYFLHINIFYTRSFIHSITNPTTFFLSISFRLIIGRDLKQAGVLMPFWKNETGEKRRTWNEKQYQWWWSCGFSQAQTVFATMLFLQ